MIAYNLVNSFIENGFILKILSLFEWSLKWILDNI